MTMTDNKCDVCNINPPIGVASTMMPLSVAYCETCARKNAQPLIVFMTLFEEIGRDYSKMFTGLPDALVTFKDGHYVTYREWADKYQPPAEEGEYD